MTEIRPRTPKQRHLLLRVLAVQEHQNVITLSDDDDKGEPPVQLQRLDQPVPRQHSHLRSAELVCFQELSSVLLSRLSVFLFQLFSVFTVLYFPLACFMCLLV